MSIVLSDTGINVSIESRCYIDSDKVANRFRLAVDLGKVISHGEKRIWVCSVDAGLNAMVGYWQKRGIKVMRISEQVANAMSGGGAFCTGFAL